MKRIFYCIALAVAMCCTACESNDDNVELTPMEQKLLEIDELIATQSSEDIDDEALIADLTTGVFISSSWYEYYGERWHDRRYETGGSTGVTVIFMEDGICRSFTESPEYIYFDMFLRELGYVGYYTEYTWSYDADTRTISTVRRGSVVKAEVRYYKDHHIIFYGDISNVSNRESFIIAGDIRQGGKREDYLAAPYANLDEVGPLFREQNPAVI